MSEWQPIETAPKKEVVLVYSWRYEVAYFSETLDSWLDTWDHRKLKGVTHWMPLPSPPQIEGEKP